jgi:two-component system KDP operon response regulator KdpE
MTQVRGRTESPPARHESGGETGGVWEGRPPEASTASPRVLIIEDEPALLRALRINLRARGFDVSTAATGREGLAEARRRTPSVVLLDLGLPDTDGIQVIRELRTWSRAPVIVLSGRAGSGDKIGALDAGADDYVTKPFDMEELLARLRAALRRTDQSSRDTNFSIGHYIIDIGAHTIVRRPPDDPPAAGTEAAGTEAAGTEAAGTEAMHLTPTEWRLLEILLNAPGQLVSSDRLLGEVWGAGFERSTHYLRFHMAGLRRKLEDDPHRPRHLLTEPGMGYRYQP